MLPEVRDKLSSTIGYNGLRQAVELLYMLQEQTGDFFGVTGSSAGQEMLHFGQSIDYNKYRIIPRAFRKMDDEID
ncbi:hypothetical protein OCU04_008883 [Sclerotinia nivalis]|uniref:Uncharacterized protein n=1 Tax=Sclerotinia nivalis TaxID=352851 RepID=A0A9X0AGE9_9HELO|nr:hypothetical protein OCU04_008883 [Sclerotinia nivalis]